MEGGRSRVPCSLSRTAFPAGRHPDEMCLVQPSMGTPATGKSRHFAHASARRAGLRRSFRIRCRTAGSFGRALTSRSFPAMFAAALPRMRVRNRPLPGTSCAAIGAVIPMPPLLGIIAGMEAEAATLGRWRTDARVEVAISAGRPGRAAAETERLIARGASALLSWGIAGGLDAGLSPGDLLVADGVVEPGGRPFAFDEGLIAACREAL